MIETPHSITVSPGWNDFLNSSHRGISYFEQFTKFQLINLNSNNYLLGENVLAVWIKVLKLVIGILIFFNFISKIYTSP